MSVSIFGQGADKRVKTGQEGRRKAALEEYDRWRHTSPGYNLERLQYV